MFNWLSIIEALQVFIPNNCRCKSSFWAIAFSFQVSQARRKKPHRKTEMNHFRVHNRIWITFRVERWQTNSVGLDSEWNESLKSSQGFFANHKLVYDFVRSKCRQFPQNAIRMSLFSEHKTRELLMTLTNTRLCYHPTMLYKVVYSHNRKLCVTSSQWPDDLPLNHPWGYAYQLGWWGVRNSILYMIRLKSSWTLSARSSILRLVREKLIDKVTQTGFMIIQLLTLD